MLTLKSNNFIQSSQTESLNLVSIGNIYNLGHNILCLQWIVLRWWLLYISINMNNSISINNTNFLLQSQHCCCRWWNYFLHSLPPVQLHGGVGGVSPPPGQDYFCKLEILELILNIFFDSLWFLTSHSGSAAPTFLNTRRRALEPTGPTSG